MKVKPNGMLAIAAYVGYLLIFIGSMIAGKADYLNLTGPDVVFRSIVVPLLLGAVYLVILINGLGWWRPVMRDSVSASPGWLKWPLILMAVAFVGLMMSATNWSNLVASQLLWLVVGSILVGFNEEALTRGVMLVGFREGGRSEAYVLLLTALFFGMLHLPNALIGLPLWAAGVQVIFASIMGAGFYVVRRTTGTLLVPMIIHGFWDFSTFVHGASGAGTPALQQPIQLTAYGLAIVCAIILILKTRGTPTNNEA